MFFFLPYGSLVFEKSFSNNIKVLLKQISVSRGELSSGILCNQEVKLDMFVGLACSLLCAD